MELTGTGAVSPSGHLPFRSANGSWVLPFDGRPTFLAVKPQDCQFAVGSRGQADVQVRYKHFPLDEMLSSQIMCCYCILNVWALTREQMMSLCFILDAGCVFPPEV